MEGAYILQRSQKQRIFLYTGDVLKKIYRTWMRVTFRSNFLYSATLDPGSYSFMRCRLAPLSSHSAPRHVYLAGSLADAVEGQGSRV